MIPALGKYNLEGKAEIHSDVTIAGGKASADGTVALADVGLSIPDQKAPPLSHLSGNIKLTGTSADVGPLTFNLGALAGDVEVACRSVSAVGHEL